MRTGREFQVRSGERSIDCYLEAPPGTEERHGSPALVVIHEIFGPDAHIRDVCRRFAEQGYVAVAPDLFTGELHDLLTPTNIGLAMKAFAEAPPGLRRDPSKLAEFAASQPPERRPVLEAFGRISSPALLEGFARDLARVSEYLRGLPNVDPHRVGAVGFCFGGAMSARLATVDPDLRGAVVLYGQNPPLGDVGKIRARVLGLYGGEDPGVTQTVPEFAAAMAAAGKEFQFHVYPGAKHAFFNDTRPTYDRPSATDAWERMLRFFGDALGP